MERTTTAFAPESDECNTGTSLEAQRHDRIKPCRAPGRHVAEDDADGGGEGERDEVDARVEEKGHAHQR